MKKKIAFLMITFCFIPGSGVLFLSPFISHNFITYITNNNNNIPEKYILSAQNNVIIPNVVYSGKGNIYYGQLHEHTSHSDGEGTLDDAYQVGSPRLDFMAVTDHGRAISEDEWNLATLKDDEYTQNGIFVGLSGFELSNTPTSKHHMNVFNTNYVADRFPNVTAAMEYVANDPNAIVQFNHPGLYGDDGYNSYKYDAKMDKVFNLMEIGRHSKNDPDGLWKHYEHYPQALDEGWHIAPTVQEDFHTANWGRPDSKTAIIADELTQEHVLDALKNMRLYATGDKNLEIDFRINGQPMGSLLNNPSILTMQVDVKDVDGENIKMIELLSSGGNVVDTHHGSGKWLKQLDSSKPYYYLRVTQSDDDEAITAPIWTKNPYSYGDSSDNVIFLIITPIIFAAFVTPLLIFVVYEFHKRRDSKNKNKYKNGSIRK